MVVTLSSPGAAAATPPQWSWTDLTRSVAPPAAAGTLLAYDSMADRFVFFGGWNGAMLGQTWQFDPVNGTWTELHPSQSPPARADATFVYDPTEDEFLLFGGWMQFSNGTYQRFDDTWSFSLTADRWTNLMPALAPSPRSDSAAAYDSADGTLFLFGGFSGTSYLGDAWAFRPAVNDWGPVTSIGPTPGPRSDGRMVYDSATDLFVLFGGNDFTGPNFTFHHLADTWLYDVGTDQWTQVSPATSPAARDYAMEGFDPSTADVILFSGYGNRTILDDTWAFSPGTGTWTMITAAGAPQGRYAGGGAYDTRDGLLLVVGGLGNSGLLNDTWSLQPMARASGAPGISLALMGGAAGFAVIGAAIVLHIVRSRSSNASD